MKRELMLKKLSCEELWDIVIIGGGATGLGTALDATSRGFKTLLLEQNDFAKGTSSRSTKLVHGGVRYLQQGDVSLVFEALKERGLMFRNAPHLVRNQSFVIPIYDWWGGPFYTVGLKVYDFMAGKLGLGPSKYISKKETVKALPNVERKGLKAGLIYHDGQFDDARMAMSLAQTCVDYGGTVINYMKVTKITKEKDIVSGVVAIDQENHQKHTIKAKVVVNATGVFADEIKKMDDPATKEMIVPSIGIHLVIDKDFLPGNHAIMVPQTSDDRVLFAVPWYNKVILGTTDSLVDLPSLEPRASEKDIDFILETAGQYLVKQPTKKDILCVFAGLRPLAMPEKEEKATKEISRHHKVLISVSGLITIIGGKWTTYRKMAEDIIDNAIMIGELPERKCITHHLLIHGYNINTEANSNPMSAYGLDQTKVQSIEGESENYRGYLSESLQIKKAQVIWAVREEMGRTIEDVLARRTRALFLDARESLRIAPETAKLMAEEFGYGEDWVKNQIVQYTELAKGYFI